MRGQAKADLYREPAQGSLMDHSTTAPYVGMAMMAASATEIDGVPIPFPFNESQIDAAIARLDDEGMEAVTIAIAVSRMPKSEEGNESGGDTSQ
jgi:hypothetical protein